MQKKLNDLEKISIKDGFWNNHEYANSILKKIKKNKNQIQEILKLDESFIEIKEYLQMIVSNEDLDYCYSQIKSFSEILNDLEIKKTLSHKDDSLSAILSIHPGAGGVESQDWAEMLYRMYKRWSESSNMKLKLLNYLPGEEAGIKDVSIEIEGPYAYGLLKAETGVHRLVRISPFDSNAKRHTSFASVSVVPILDDEIEVKINDSDLKIDTYKASGAGGQHVNKTESAVRITHNPTGIIVQCQNQRSQLKNKNAALKMLKSKIYIMKKDKIEAQSSANYNQKNAISWGSQIRSYVFHPYNMVKDHRTNLETSNISDIMDGKINQFIKAYLLESYSNEK